MTDQIDKNIECLKNEISNVILIVILWNISLEKLEQSFFPLKCLSNIYKSWSLKNMRPQSNTVNNFKTKKKYVLF